MSSSWKYVACISCLWCVNIIDEIWRWHAAELLSIIVLSSHNKMHLQKWTNDRHHRSYRLFIKIQKIKFYAGECIAHHNYWYTWKYATGYRNNNNSTTTATCTALVDFNVNLFKQDYYWKSYVDLIYCHHKYG